MQNGNQTSKNAARELLDGAIPRRKLSDEVKDRLLDLVESGKVKPGEQLPSERELMAAFGVGRPAIREAMQSIEQMGLIAIQHGERARVVSLSADAMLGQIDRAARHLVATSPETAAHLREARLMFEVAMVRKAAVAATSENIEALRQALRRQEACSQDRPEFVAADVAFHETIASISGNPILSAVSRSMLQWLSSFHVELVKQPGAEAVTLAEHRQIVERIAAKDAEGAAAAMTEHINRTGPLRREFLEKGHVKT